MTTMDAAPGPAQEAACNTGPRSTTNTISRTTTSSTYSRSSTSSTSPRGSSPNSTASNSSRRSAARWTGGHDTYIAGTQGRGVTWEEWKAGMVGWTTQTFALARVDPRQTKEEFHPTASEPKEVMREIMRDWQVRCDWWIEEQQRQHQLEHLRRQRTDQWPRGKRPR